MKQRDKTKNLWSQVKGLRWRWLNDFPFIEASTGVECGPACLSLIAKFYGYNYAVDYVAQLANMDQYEGTSLRGIIEAASKIGFETMAIRVPLRFEDEAEPSLLDAPLPCILHWDKNLFVVLYRIANAGFYIMNPTVGKQLFTEEEFMHRWLPNDPNIDNQGIALLIEKK